MEKNIALINTDNVDRAFDNITFAVHTQQELKRNKYYYSPKEYKQGQDDINDVIIESLKLTYHVN